MLRIATQNVTSDTVAKVTRGERVLSTLEREGLTKEGKAFLIAALDPMHDTQIERLQGWPDVETAASVVRCIKQQVEIKKPAGLPAGTWDCHFVHWPILHEITGTLSLCTDGLLNPIAAGGNPSYGGLQAFAASAGVDMPFNNLLSGPVPAGSLSLDPIFDKGVGRLVGSGFEIYNTTSELYKQGLVTVYRQPQMRDVQGEFLWSDNASAFSQPVACDFMRLPPSSLSQATLYPGSRSWEAKEGAYVVVPFSGSSNPPRMHKPCTLMATPDLSNTKVGSTGPTNTVWVSVGGQTPTWPNPGSGLYAYNQKMEYIHTAGAYFTGLSPETTLTLTWHVYYESFPSADEKEILVLASPSSVYDPLALQLFTQTLNKMPVGVPSPMNASGDWFWNLVDMIAGLASPIGALVAGPGGAALGSILGKGAQGVASIARNQRATEKAKKKRKKTVSAPAPKRPPTRAAMSRGQPPQIPPRISSARR